MAYNLGHHLLARLTQIIVTSPVDRFMFTTLTKEIKSVTSTAKNASAAKANETVRMRTSTNSLTVVCQN